MASVAFLLFFSFSSSLHIFFSQNNIFSVHLKDNNKKEIPFVAWCSSIRIGLRFICSTNYDRDVYICFLVRGSLFIFLKRSYLALILYCLHHKLTIIFNNNSLFLFLLEFVCGDHIYGKSIIRWTTRSQRDSHNFFLVCRVHVV